MSDPAYVEQTPEQQHPVKAVSIPRISIQAFCESQETAHTLQNAAADRRLTRAHVNVQTGGIAGAGEFFGNSPTPNLLIVESSARREPMMEELARLAEVCDSGTKVIVIGHVNDVILYRELIRQGVSEYVVAPVDELQIIETIAGLYADPRAKPVGRVSVFVGAKGGCGSSTVAHNVAWELARRMELSTVVADFDLPFGTASLDFNQDPPQGMAEALAAPDRLDETLLDRLLSKCSDHLSLLTAPGTIDRDYPVDENTIDGLMELMRHSMPHIIADVPHMWSPWLRKVLVSADEVVITASPDLANLRNAKNIIDLLKAERPNDPAPKLVLNQVGVPKRPEIAAKDFAAALELEPVLILPFEPQLFGTAANNGQMIEEVSGRSKTAEGFAFLARQLSQSESANASQGSRLAPILGRLPFIGGKAKSAN